MTLAQRFEVQAENVAEARRIAKGLRVIAETQYGARRPGPHDRDLIVHECKPLWPRRIAVERKDK